MSRVIWFDLETTGTDPYQDRIVEIAMITDSPGDLAGPRFETRINPGVPIPASATEIHGITDEDVADERTFAELAPRIQELVGSGLTVLAGYNIRRFDTILLDAELKRAGERGLPRDEYGRIATREIDLYQIWQRCEPRTLVSASSRFAGVDLEDAHSAGADTRVLPKVLAGMASEYGLSLSDVSELARLSIPDGALDRDHRFAREEDGTVVFAFGKHKDKPASSQPGYLRWMLSKDFSEETKAFAKILLEAPEALDPVPAGG